MYGRMVTLVFIAASSALAQTPGENEHGADEATLRDQRLPTGGAGLVQILHDRTPSEEAIKRFDHHLDRLNASNFLTRAQATGELRKMGPVIRPLAEKLLLDGKIAAETAGRLREVLAEFPADKDIAAVSAASRLLVRDRPAGSLTALIDFAPYATDELLRQDVQRAINAIAKAQKPTPMLVDLLKDPAPARRAAAAEALLHTLGLAAKKPIAALLADPHPLVRHQIGMALVDKHDKTGVPLLIQSLADAPAERAEFAIDLLYRIAGDKAPDVAYHGRSEADAFRATWKKWHDENKDALDLSKLLTGDGLGYTVIATNAIKANTRSKILEVGRGPKQPIRWEFDGPRYPVDLQVLGPNRILIAEYYDNRVTERDFKGGILWQTQANMPIACQRLPNGHTFIATRRQLLIVDRDSKVLFNHASQTTSIVAAQRLRNGQFAKVVSGGICSLLDRNGTELKNFRLGGNVYTLGGNIEVLSNGRVLVPLYNKQCVAEFDWNGNMHWSAAVNRPISVTRLKNGHTLVSCSIDYRVVELDEHGKEVWSYRTDGRPFRARRR